MLYIIIYTILFWIAVIGWFLNLCVGRIVFSTSVWIGYTVMYMVVTYLLYYAKKYAKWRHEPEILNGVRVAEVGLRFEDFLDYYSLFSSSFLFSSLNITDIDKDKAVDKIFFAKEGWKITPKDVYYEKLNQYRTLSFVWQSYWNCLRNALINHDDDVFRLQFSFIDYMKYQKWRKGILFAEWVEKNKKRKLAFIVKRNKKRAGVEEAKKQDKTAQILFLEHLLAKIEVEKELGEAEIQKGLNDTSAVLEGMVCSTAS